MQINWNQLSPAIAGGVLVTVLMCTDVMAADLVEVNGQGISQAMFEENLKSNLAQGQKDTPELRKAIMDELINRVLLVQGAEKAGLTKTPEARLSVEQLKENFEASLMLNDYLAKNPVTDADVRAEYDRQITVVGGAKAQQYEVSVIVLKTKIEADDVLSSLKKGASFEAVAKERSVVPSKAQGGKIGWVFPAQLPQPLGTALSKMTKPGLVTSPVELQGAWYVLKVDDKRPFKTPSFEESKDRIRAGLLQQRRAALLQQLRASAKISAE